MKITIFKNNPKNLLEKSFSVNEVNQICPFSPPMMIPGRLAGEVQIITKPCSNTCPHMSIDKNDHIQITCSGSPIIYKNLDSPGL